MAFPSRRDKASRSDESESTGDGGDDSNGDDALSRPAPPEDDPRRASNIDDGSNDDTITNDRRTDTGRKEEQIKEGSDADTDPTPTPTPPDDGVNGGDNNTPSDRPAPGEDDPRRVDNTGGDGGGTTDRRTPTEDKADDITEEPVEEPAPAPEVVDAEEVTEGNVATEQGVEETGATDEFVAGDETLTESEIESRVAEQVAESSDALQPGMVEGRVVNGEAQAVLEGGTSTALISAGFEQGDVLASADVTSVREAGQIAEQQALEEIEADATAQDISVTFEEGEFGAQPTEEFTTDEIEAQLREQVPGFAIERREGEVVIDRAELQERAEIDASREMDTAVGESLRQVITPGDGEAPGPSIEQQLESQFGVELSDEDIQTTEQDGTIKGQLSEQGEVTVAQESAPLADTPLEGPSDFVAGTQVRGDRFIESNRETLDDALTGAQEAVAPITDPVNEGIQTAQDLQADIEEDIDVTGAPPVGARAVGGGTLPRVIGAAAAIGATALTVRNNRQAVQTTGTTTEVDIPQDRDLFADELSVPSTTETDVFTGTATGSEVALPDPQEVTDLGIPEQGVEIDAGEDIAPVDTTTIEGGGTAQTTQVDVPTEDTPTLNEQTGTAVREGGTTTDEPGMPTDLPVSPTPARTPGGVVEGEPEFPGLQPRSERELDSFAERGFTVPTGEGFPEAQEPSVSLGEGMGQPATRPLGAPASLFDADGLADADAFAQPDATPDAVSQADALAEAQAQAQAQATPTTPSTVDVPGLGLETPSVNVPGFDFEFPAPNVNAPGFAFPAPAVPSIPTQKPQRLPPQLPDSDKDKEKSDPFGEASSLFDNPTLSPKEALDFDPTED